MAWIDKIANSINTAISSLRPPATPIPPILLLCEIIDRPGLSAISLTSAIISRFPEIGIPTGVNEDGTENLVNKYTKVFAEEIIKEFQNHGLINCAIQPGSINITGSGVAAGIAPVAVTGTNSMPSSVNGIIR